MPRVTGALQAPRKGILALGTIGKIGKIACTRNFHCVNACDSLVFYKILTQLN